MQQISGVQTDQLGSERALMALVNAGSMSQAVCVAAELEIADLLSDGPKNADALAHATQCHAPSLKRLMRALTALGICTENKDATFALTEVGARLRTDTETSLRSWTLWSGRHMWPVWGELGYSVRSGENARKLFTGMNGFGHLERDETVAAVFNAGMAEITRLVARDLVAGYDFGTMNRLVDVGGGYGTLIMSILNAYPQMRGIVFDRPHAMTGGQSRASVQGLAGRCEMTAGDFFQSVPAGADGYLLKSILHDWDDANASAILRNCRHAIPAHGKLLVVERILPDRFDVTVSHCAIARSDLNMLVALGGRERTESEYGRLLAGSAFAAGRVIPIGFEYNLIEATPV